MSEELKSFLQNLRTQPDLLEELRSLRGDPEAAIQWAREQGCNLTPGDVAELLESDRELSDDELEQAAGGDSWPPP